MTESTTAPPKPTPPRDGEWLAPVDDKGKMLVDPATGASVVDGVEVSYNRRGEPTVTRPDDLVPGRDYMEGSPIDLERQASGEDGAVSVAEAVCLALLVIVVLALLGALR